MPNTALNELRVGFILMHLRRFPPTNNVPSMQDLGVRLPIYPDKPSISQIEANGFFNIGDNLEASYVPNGLELNDRFTWVKGKHSIQVGGEAQNYTVTIRNQFRRAGHFTFDGSRTGHPIADFLLGYVQTFDQGTGEYKDYNVWYGSSFVQDDFKVSQKLTLNLGVRYESSPPWHETVGRIEQFTLEDFNNNVRSTVFPQALRGRAAYVRSHYGNGPRPVQCDPTVSTPGHARGTDGRRLLAAAGIGQVNHERQDRESLYDGVQLTISNRYSRGFTVTSNYT